MTQNVKDRTPKAPPGTAGSRRKFLRLAGAGAAGAAATVAMPQISRAQTMVLKMQGSWGAGDIFNDYANEFVSRVNEMGGGRLKIQYLNAGAVVKAFEVQDAVNKGVLDAGHLVPAYWYGKNRAASLFGTGPCYGWDAHQFLAWFYGPGQKLYEELTQKVLGLNIVGWFLMPMPTQPLGWFKKAPKTADDMKGLKYRTVGLATNVMQAMGLKVTPASRRRDHPRHGKGRDRGVRVQQPDLGPPVRRRRRRQGLHAVELPPAVGSAGDRVQQDQVRRPGEGAAGDHPPRGRGGVVVQSVDRLRALPEGPAGADPQGQGDGEADARLDPQGAARRRGTRWSSSTTSRSGSRRSRTTRRPGPRTWPTTSSSTRTTPNSPTTTISARSSRSASSAGGGSAVSVRTGAAYGRRPGFAARPVRACGRFTVT